jgi:DNA-directed RNA polymerase specialized sigma24 family protein
VPRLALHDVDDTAAFVGAIVNRSQLELSFHDREDLGQFLVIECWLLSEQFEPGRGISFSTYAGTTLRRRVIDWQRAKVGRTVWKFKDRTHTRELPQFVPLDADDGEPFAELGSPQRRGSLDDAERRLADGLRSLEARARRPPGRNHALDYKRLQSLQRELVRLTAVATPVDGSETTPGPHRQCI